MSVQELEIEFGEVLINGIMKPERQKTSITNFRSSLLENEQLHHFFFGNVCPICSERFACIIFYVSLKKHNY